MARFKRRKPRVVWLPVLGTDFADDPEETNAANGIGDNFVVPGDGTLVTQINPVTFDYTDSPSGESASFERSLQDLTSGNAYRLRRIVGKCFIAGVSQSNVLSGDLPLLDVAAGFMVNRTDDSGNILQPGSLDPEIRGPLAQDSAQDPWIWRRRWLLSSFPPWYSTTDYATVHPLTGGSGAFPHTTAHYGSVADGPHIDQKTARVISNQERLFFWIQARVANASVNTLTAVCNWYLDLRILASLRMNQGNRRNASR